MMQTAPKNYLGCRLKFSISLRLIFIIYSNLKEKDLWIGRGTNVDFWHDNWLGGALNHTFNLTYSMVRCLTTSVADFTVRGQWCLPLSLVMNRHDVAAQINIRPCFGEDTLIQTSSSNGSLSLSLGESYEACQSRGTDFSWLAKVWQSFIPRRRSILAIRVLRNRIATNDNVRKCSLVVTSIHLLHVYKII